MEISNDQTKTEYNQDKALIYLVQQYPLLYDEQHIYFRHSKQRHSSWNEIAKLLKTTNKDCRMRWKTLREHWKRQKKLNMSGQNMTTKKPFEYFKEMKFLDPETSSQEERPFYASDDSNLLISQVCTTVMERSPDQDAINGYCNFVAGNASQANESQIQPKIEEVDLTEDDIIYEDEEPDSCIDKADPTQQRASSHELKQMQVQGSSPPWPRKEQNGIINSTSGDIEDEFHIAGRRIGYQLRSVDDFQRTIAEKLISDIVFNAKMGNLTENSAITLDATETHHGHIPNGRRPMPMQY